MNNYMTPSEEKRIKQEFVTYLRKGDIDANIKSDLIRINKIKGIATLVSCEGHNSKCPYIVFAVSKAQEKKLNEWISYFVKLHIDTKKRYKVKTIEIPLYDFDAKKKSAIKPAIAVYGDVKSPELFREALHKLR